MSSTEYLLMGLFEYWWNTNGNVYFGDTYNDPEEAINDYEVADNFYGFLGYNMEMYDLDSVNLGCTSSVQEAVQQAYKHQTVSIPC